jgi:aminoglycoside phosphotransferase (APT) family kinase protein
MSSCNDEDEGCIATTFERKYYHREQVFIKRSLRPREFRTGYRGLHIPPFGIERLKNEAESLQFIRRHTDIPVPTLYCHFLDDGAYYLITEFVEGTSMADLPAEQKAIVCEELEKHREKLRTLKSNRIGGPSGIIIPPYRVLKHAETECWKLEPSSKSEYVFCHNDLSQQNVIVDRESLKIKAIIDWEYAGFFPPQFDYPFYERLGPSSAINGETDDSLALLDYLRSRASGNL